MPNPLPFAAIPFDLVEDPRLQFIDQAVVAVLLRFIHGDQPGWVSNQTIATRLRISTREVQRSIGRLSKRWIVVERGVGIRGKKRRITIRWRTDLEPMANTTQPSVSNTTASSVSPALNMTVPSPELDGKPQITKKESVSPIGYVPSISPPAKRKPSPKAPRQPEERPTAEECRSAILSVYRSPEDKERPRLVGRVARLLMVALCDPDEQFKSGFCGVLTKLAKRTIFLDDFMQAFDESYEIDGGLRNYYIENPGAFFFATLKALIAKRVAAPDAEINAELAAEHSGCVTRG